MVNIYILVIALLLSANPAQAIFGWGKDDEEIQEQNIPQQQQPIPVPQQNPIPQQNIPRQNQQRWNPNVNAPGTVTGIMNRIPRRFDRQTLINQGPGLLQDAYYLFRRMGSGNTNDGQRVPQQQNQQTLPQQVQMPPQTNPVQTFPVENNSMPIPTPDPVISSPLPPLEPLDIKEPGLDTNKATQPLMLPAPKPGYIIRYNQEKGVYEEVRELPIGNIPSITE